MNKIMLVIFSLFLLAGCSGPEYGEEYTVYIHPDFGSKIENVIGSAATWSKASGVLMTPVISEPYHCSDTGNICVYIANEDAIIKQAGHADPDGMWLGVTHRDDNDFATILILDQILVTDPDPQRELVQEKVRNETILHELGHAMGLHHDPQKGNVMYKSVDGSALYPTCRDLMQYFSFRGINYYC